MEQVQVSARIGAMIVHGASVAGVDPSELRAATGFDPSLASDADARIPISLEEALWVEAARRTGDDFFALHAAEAIRPGMFDVLDYAVRTAPTLREALDRLARYNRLEHDLAIFSIEDRGEVVRVEHGFRTPGLRPVRHASEFTLASLVVIGSQMLGEPLHALAVQFGHEAPAELSEFERLFGVQPRFDFPGNAIAFDSTTLHRPLPAADPSLWRVMERYAEDLLSTRPEPAQSTAQRVRRMLSSTLGEGDVSLGGTAARLRMSERSLQRRLADEGVSFELVLDALRRELALRYLGDRRLAISEVAYLLGYSEPSAFHRAFKRWTGHTPSELRRTAG